MTENMAQSVRDRLRNRARERHEDFNYLLYRFAAERLLYRLSISPYRDRFVLKGASLFALWAEQPHRATNDLDLEGFGDHDADSLIRIFRSVCQNSAEDDGMTYDPDTITAAPIREATTYGGIRVRIPARIGNARANVQIDVGFGDAITPDPEEVSYPTLLHHPSPSLRAYPRVTVIAEKWEALVTLGERNGRMKDFYDLSVLARAFFFDGELLARAIANTFQRRGTALPDRPPVVLTSDWIEDASVRSRWAAFIRRGAVSDNQIAIAAVVASIEAFVMPPTRALVSGQLFSANWQPGGPWQDRNPRAPDILRS